MEFARPATDGQPAPARIASRMREEHLGLASCTLTTCSRGNRGEPGIGPRRSGSQAYAVDARRRHPGMPEIAPACTMSPDVVKLPKPDWNHGHPALSHTEMRRQFRELE